MNVRFSVKMKSKDATSLPLQPINATQQQLIGMMLTNNSYQDKLNTLGQKYNGHNLTFVNPQKYDSFPTNSNDSIDKTQPKTKLPATLNLHPANYANNTSAYLSESPGQATGSEGDRKRL